MIRALRLLYRPRGAPPSAARAADHVLRDKKTAGVDVAAAASARPRAPPSKPVLLPPLDLDDDTAQVLPSAAGTAVTARQLWATSCVARRSRETRHNLGSCVVGGATAIHRVWREYGVQPTVVYVPDTEPTVPTWCLLHALPTYIVRCSPVKIRRDLLSAEYSDGYAAEFPWDPLRLAPLTSLLRTATDASATARSMVVLVGLRIPSNLGTLLRAAVEMGYEHVALLDCVDPFHEKVVRASDGVVFSPCVRLLEASHEDGGSLVAILSAVAAQHQLVPLLAVPSQAAESAFTVAQRFHACNAGGTAPDAACVSDDSRAAAVPPAAGARGPMLVLGAESQGLRALDGEWSVPFQTLSLPLPNPTIDSFNVSVAGSILMHLFRPAAAKHFRRLATLIGGSSATDARQLPETEAKTPATKQS